MEEIIMAYYTIKSRLGNNLYLSVDAGRTSVSLKTGVASANQQWRCSGLRHNVEVYSGSLTIQMPSGRNCNWNQYYTEIADAIGDGGRYACTITTALDLMNFYGPDSYTIIQAKVGWRPSEGIVWGTAWPGDFRTGDKFTSLAQPEFFALIRSEISQGRPVIVNVGTDNSHSHTVMCYGYTNLNSDYSDFLVMDPAGTGSSGANNPNGQMSTLWQAMDYSHRTDGIWSMFFTYSKA